MSRFTAFTTDPVVSPATPQGLADWLRLDDDTDPVLPGLLDEATGIVIGYIQQEILPRNYVLTYEEWPTTVMSKWGDISKPYGRRDRDIELPYAGALDGQPTAEIYGQVEDIRVLSTRPVSVRLPSNTTTETGLPAIKIEYRAGYETPPSELVQAVIRVAGFLFAHRGVCSATDAITESGAARLLQPWRMVLI